MTNIEKAKEGLAKTKTMDIKEMIQASLNELGKALPSHMNPERLVRIALTTLRLNPELYSCTPESFLGALFQSAQLGLEPNIEGQAYIIAYNKKYKEGNEWKTKKEAQFQIGYKGYVELFYRHQSALSLQMEKVCANDEFDFSYGTESHLKHKPANSNRGDVIGYYAVAKMQNGAHAFKYMSKDDCMEHGKNHSKCVDKKNNTFYSNTPWVTDVDSMCLKTVLIQLMKLLPKSIEIQKAMAMDNTVKTKIDTDMFNIKDETDWNNEPIEAVIASEKEEEKIEFEPKKEK